MQNGEVIKHEYQLNLDTLAEGMIIGLMRHNDKTLHFYLNEVDRSVIVAGNSKSSGLLVVTPVLKIANFH